MKAKKWIIAIIIIAVAAVAAWFGLTKSGILGGNSAGSVYVEAVSALNGGSNSGLENRYAGIVETQKEWTASPENGQAVKEVLVKEGDKVEVGQELFTYDTDSLKLSLSQAQLELEQIQNEVTETNSQIKNLESEKNGASKSEKYRITLEINQLQTTIKQDNYKIQSKKEEISDIQKAIENSVVVSEISGVVKTVGEINQDDQSDSYDMYGNESSSNALITILASDSYRVKGQVNETNISSISEGMPVIIRSRVDETMTWTGTISEIETDKKDSDDSNSGYVDSSSSSEMYGSTNYPFYISLETMDGLMLGQHVYIELNDGQTETKEGIWLYSGYILRDENTGASDNTSAVAETTTGYVWADKDGRIEKRAVELGEYDADLDMYQIVSGLELTDYVAWPMDRIKAGMKTTTNMEEAMTEEDTQTDEFEGSSVEEEYTEDSSADDEYDYVDEEYVEDSSDDTESMDGEILDANELENDIQNADEEPTEE